jgi:hypothetical protein
MVLTGDPLCLGTVLSDVARKFWYFLHTIHAYTYVATLKLVSLTMSSIQSLRSLRPAAARSLVQRTRPLSSLSTSQHTTRRSGLQYARTRTRPGPLLVVPSACVALRGGVQSLRGYANGAGGGGGKGFPGFSLGPQHQKGEALKEYVRWQLDSSTCR